MVCKNYLSFYQLPFILFILSFDGSKLGKEYVKAVYCNPVYLTYTEYIMQNARLIRWNQDCWEKYQ